MSLSANHGQVIAFGGDCTMAVHFEASLLLVSEHVEVCSHISEMLQEQY